MQMDEKAVISNERHLKWWPPPSWIYYFSRFWSRWTIGLSICVFLLVVHCNHASILHHYGDIGPHRYWGHDLDFFGSCDAIDHVTIGLGVGPFLLVVNYDHAVFLSCTDTDIWGFKDFGVTSLTFWGHVTSSVTWPSDSAWALSYWWSMMNMRLSCSGTNIWGFEDFGVLSLTFWGHVTSSITWPLNSAYVVFY